jgi:hypothetical protein
MVPNVRGHRRSAVSPSYFFKNWITRSMLGRVVSAMRIAPH